MRARRHVAVAVVVLLAGCAAATSRVADATFMGQQIRCSQKYATRVEIDRCREEVRRAWHVSDAGDDASDASEGGDAHDR